MSRLHERIDVMSKAAEDAHTKWFAQHEIECARDLVIGTKVYRVMGNCIEEGVVIRVSRARINQLGNSDAEECENGERPYYVARFRDNDYEWRATEGQTYQWKFFANISDARKQLVRKLRDQIEEHYQDVKKLEKLIATLDVNESEK